MKEEKSFLVKIHLNFGDLDEYDILKGLLSSAVDNDIILGYSFKELELPKLSQEE